MFVVAGAFSGGPLGGWQALTGGRDSCLDDVGGSPPLRGKLSGPCPGNRGRTEIARREVACSRGSSRGAEQGARASKEFVELRGVAGGSEDPLGCFWEAWKWKQSRGLALEGAGQNGNTKWSARRKYSVQSRAAYGGRVQRDGSVHTGQPGRP